MRATTTPPTKRTTREHQAPALDQLVELFLDHLRYDRNCAAGTIERYTSNLRIFAADLGQGDITALEASDFTTWKRVLMERRLSIARVANLLFTVRSLLRFCREHLELDVLDPRKVTIPKAPQRVPEVLTPEEQEAFLTGVRQDCARGNRYAVRFLALVLCLRSSGARIGELLALDRAALDLALGEAKVLGKGDKERILYFSEEALRALQRYLGQRSDDLEPLFTTHGTARRWDKGEAQPYFHRYARRAGISKRVTAHMFRRIFCTTLHRNGADLLTIKELAGHADVKTTMRYYIAPDQTHLREQYRRFLRF